MIRDDASDDLFNLVPADPSEKDMFYTYISKPQEQACVGHLRGYYDNNGKQVITSWFDHQSDLKTQDFRDEFDRLVNCLLEKGILNTRQNLEKFFLRQPEARIVGARYEDTFGFRAMSKDYFYYLRMSLERGDYAIYCYAYNCELLHLQEQAIPIKKNEPER
jgi:hypothetical protein